MVVVNVCGGLGNQMFQYAYYKLLKNSHVQAALYIDSDYFATTKVRATAAAAAGKNKFYLQNYHIPGYMLPELFDISAEYIDKSDLKKYRSNIIKRVVYPKLGIHLPTTIYENSYSKQQLESGQHLNVSDAFMLGYWQQLSLYDCISDELKKDFTFKNPLDAKNRELAQKIQNSPSVSIHVRRGDYLKNPDVYPQLDADYYSRALEIVKEAAPNPEIFCFSDDIEWCRENLKFDNMTFVDWNLGYDNYKDMQLMSLCKHNITANSTFSAWAAWLNANPDKKVVCPAKFDYLSHGCEIHNFLPDSWIKL